jgi:ATP synthase protein I
MTKKRNSNANRNINQYAKYSGIGFQMLGIIVFGVWAGVKLDDRFQTSKPVFTIVLSVLGVFAALYVVLKDFIIKRK